MRFAMLIGLLLSAVPAAFGQLMFETTFDQYEHLQSDWDRWSKMKVGDFVEYSDLELGTVVVRFRVTKIGEREVTLLTETFPAPGFSEKREIRHVFHKDSVFEVKPQATFAGKVTLGEKEFTAERREFLAPDKSPIKYVWYSDTAPFDGMVKYEQFTLGKPSGGRVVSRFKFGETQVGKPLEDAPPKVATAPPRDTPREPPPSEPAVDGDADPTKSPRKWTSVDGKMTLEATLVKATATTVTLKRKDNGQPLQLNVTRLSKEDREFLRAWSLKK